jgi:hypothetical protein
MALSLANGVTAVRDVLNESTAVFWSDTQIENWIKEGCRHFSSKSLLVQKDDNAVLTASDLFYTSAEGAGYTWIADCLKIHTAYYDDGSNNYAGLMKIEPNQIGNVGTFTPGDPKYYCLFNRSIYIWPMTTAAIVTAGGLVTFLYAKETDDFTEIPDEFQHLPIVYALGRAKQRDMKFSEANSFFAQYNAELEFERGDKDFRGTETYDDFKIKTVRRQQ